MRTLLIIISLTYFSCSGNSSDEKKTVINGNSSITIDDTSKINCVKPNIENLIVHSDTTVDYPHYKGHTIKSFDVQKRVRQIFESNLFESNSKNIVSSTIIYDTIGHIIYEDKTKEFIRWHYYCYKYDTNGHLVFKEGYSSNEMGIKVLYIYDNDKLIKEITEHSGQKNEKNY